MTCRRLSEVPKGVFQRFYLQPQGITIVSPRLATRTQHHLDLVQFRCASTEAVQEIPAAPEFKDNFFRRCRRKIGLPDYSASFYRAQGVFIYEKLDTVAVSELFKEFQIEDTFYSWFLIMELHLWMVLSRASQHAKEGHIVKEYIGKVMWEDVRRRIKLVVPDLSVSDQSKTLDNFSSEMEFSLILYDEAVLSTDKRLAEALWVRLYRGKEVDPVILEKVVCYVRKQVQHLELIPMEQFLLNAQFSWLPLKECRI